MYSSWNDHSWPIDLKGSVATIFETAFYPCFSLISDISPICYCNQMHFPGLACPAQHFIMEVNLAMLPVSETKSID